MTPATLGSAGLTRCGRRGPRAGWHWAWPWLLPGLASLALSLSLAARDLGPEFVLRAECVAPERRQTDAVSALVVGTPGTQDAVRLELGRRTLRLVRQSQAGTEILAGPSDIAEPPAQPTRLLLRCLGDRWLACLGDRRLTASGRAPASAEARLDNAPGGPVLSGLRAQPLAPLAFADDFMRGPGEAGAWEAQTGTWELDSLPNADWTPNAFRLVGRGPGLCLNLAGEWFWDGFGLTAAVQPGREGRAAGLACCMQEDGTGLVFRWIASSDGYAGCRQGRLELVWVGPNREGVLQQIPWTWDPGQWYRLGLLVLEGRVAAFVDGRFVLSAPARAVSGRVGLYCQASPGTRFDDVLLRSLPPAVLGTGLGDAPDAALLPRPVSAVAERFRTDQYMQGWASELGSWLPVPGVPQAGTYRHLGLFPGDFGVSWAGRDPVPFNQGALEIHVLPEGGRSADGYGVRMARAGGALTATIVRKDHPLGEGRLAVPESEPVRSLRVTRTGGALAVQANDAEVVRCTDPEPLATRRLVAVCPWSHSRELSYFTAEAVHRSRQRLPAVQDLVADCPQAWDYLFDRVPVDWIADTGTWEITPRWICLPMFSWLGGRSHEPAIFWNKHRFAGDLVVDVHAAVMMDFGPMSGYDRYGDLCVTVCADGRDLSSGYTVQFGAEGNSVSRIWRRDQVVAANPGVTYPPRSEGAHQSWYHLTVEKRGAEVSFSLDNRPVATFTDPEPLSGGHVALWTWNRGMMVARARIWADRDEGMAGDAFLRPLARGPAPDPNAAPPPAVPMTVSHPGRWFRFDSGTEGWGTTSPQHGPAVEWEAKAPGGVLRCTNPHTGGDLSVAFPVPEFDAKGLPLLQFDAAFDPGTRVNLYLRAEGQWYVLGLTGPVTPEFHQISESREISGRLTATTGLQLEEPPPVCIGDLALPDDGAWHAVRVDLLDCLERLRPGQESYRVSALQIGNWSNAGYLQCGFGGNRLGAVYRLDNVWLGAAGPGREATFAGWPWDATGSTATAWRWCIDRSPDTVPDGHLPASPGQIRVEGLASGTWFLHLVDAAGGSVPQVRHHRFVVDSELPLLIGTEPAEGAEGAANELRLTVTDTGGSGLRRQSLRIAVGDSPLDPAQLAWQNGAHGETVIRASLRGLTFADGQAVPCSVRLGDRAGNALAGACSWSWTYRQAADHQGPSLPVLTAPAASSWDEDFEHAGGAWGPFPGSAWAEAILDRSTAASGESCLRVSGGPGPYRCYVRREPFDLLARPILLLDYQATADSVWDLAFETDRGWWVVSACNASASWPVVGRLQDYRPDGQWHTAAVPLADWLGRRRAFGVPAVRSVAVVADRMEGGRRTRVRLDSVCLAPAVWTGQESVLRWQAEDVGGIAGYRFAVDQDPATVLRADTPLGPDSCELRALRPGPQILHVQAWDKAGNASPTLHQPLLRQAAEDSTPPRVTGTLPAAGASAAPDAVVLNLAETGSGISLETVWLEVAKRVYTHRDANLRFDPEANTLSWSRPPDWPPSAALFPDGYPAVVRLRCRDRAGNPLGPPLELSWTMAFAEDKTAPAPPCVSWGTDQTAMEQDFEKDAGLCMGLREGWAVRTEDTAGTGQASLRFGGFSTFLCASSYPADRFPFVSFLYRFAPGCQASLAVRSENRNWEVQLNGDQARYPLIGRVEGIVADDRWHFCRLNVAELLRKAPEPSRTLAVDYLASLVKTGDGFWVDDIRVEGPGTGTVTARWSVPCDATGIQGYSLAEDDRPDTIPDARVDTTETHHRLRLPASGWTWLHLRAIDGAGNAGDTAHIRVEPGWKP